MSRFGTLLVCVLAVASTWNVSAACRPGRSHGVAAAQPASTVPPVCGPAGTNQGPSRAAPNEANPPEVEPFSQPLPPPPSVQPITQKKPASPVRTWTDASGKYHVEAMLAGVSEGNAQLVREDGRTIFVPVWRLSVEDRNLLGIAPPEPRQWSDDKAKHHVVARLVEIRSSSVRLELQNTHTIVVPMDRLSQGDQQYVAQCNGQAQHVETGRLASLSMVGR
jgi:hypothetical protein